jgi:hypothetical protein
MEEDHTQRLRQNWINTGKTVDTSHLTKQAKHRTNNIKTSESHPKTTPAKETAKAAGKAAHFQ